MTAQQPNSETAATFLEYENTRPHADSWDLEASRSILDQLLLSDDFVPEDLPYVLACFYWIRGNTRKPYDWVHPELRLQCNKRQRKIFNSIELLLGISDGDTLSTRLVGADVYDSALRFCAFLELTVSRKGPFEVFPTLDKIMRNGKLEHRGKPLKMDHLFKTSPDSITALLTTVVHALGRLLSANVGCRARQLNDTVSSLSLLLALFGERDVAKVFHGVVRQLRSGGELLLLYLLLLCTGLPETEEKDQMWRLLEFDLARRCAQSSMQKVAVVLVGLTNMIYLCGEGSRALFPFLYKEICRRKLAAAARRAWALTHSGNSQVWDDLAATLKIDRRNARNEYLRRLAQHQQAEDGDSVSGSDGQSSLESEATAESDSGTDSESS